MTQPRQWWHIHISGYGSFAFFGTPGEASEARIAKAKWEGGRGTICVAYPEEIAAEKDHLSWKQQQGYPLTENELEALKS